MPDTEFPHDVFLSYSSKDKSVVRPLAERLRKDGLKVWFDDWELKPGDSIPAKIRHARYWTAQAFPVLLVIRDSEDEVRWMRIDD